MRAGDDDNHDDDSDHKSASNLPEIQNFSPSSAKAGTTFSLTITGVRLTGATVVTFDKPSNGNGEGNRKGKDKSKKKDSDHDDDFTVTNLQVSAGGTQITATVSIAASANPGARTLRVTTPNGTSSDKSEAGPKFVVNP